MYTFLDDVFGDKYDDLDEGNWPAGRSTWAWWRRRRRQRRRRRRRLTSRWQRRAGKEAKLPVVQRGGAWNDPKQQVQRRLRDMVFRANALLGREREALEAAERPRPSFY